MRLPSWRTISDPLRTILCFLWEHLRLSSAILQQLVKILVAFWYGSPYSQKSISTHNTSCLWSMGAKKGRSKSRDLRGFSKLHLTPHRLQISIASAVKSASSKPILSFSLALREFRIPCRALLKTVQGVPKWTYAITPLRSQCKTTSWVALLRRSWSDVKMASIGVIVASPALSMSQIFQSTLVLFDPCLIRVFFFCK